MPIADQKSQTEKAPGRTMSSEKALSDEILKDAQKRADRIRSRAEREAQKILDDAVKEAEAAAQKILDAAKARGGRVAQSVLATVEQEARRDLLKAQEAELEKLFEAARARLAGRSSVDAAAVLTGLAAEAIAAMPADKVVVQMSEADRAVATEAWVAEVRRRVGREVAIAVAKEPAAVSGGVVVRSADGRLLYDNSYEARLGRLRPELRRELVAKIYEKA